MQYYISLSLVIVLFISLKIQTDFIPHTDEYNNNPAGKELYKDFGCTVCHGNNMEGTDIGPELSGLHKYFNVDELVQYLIDPTAVMARKDRLQELDEEFDAVEMPSFGDLPEEELRILAEYLLKNE